MDNSIHFMRTEAPLLAPIFRSDGQARLLGVLVLDGDEFSISDLAKRADLAYPTAHREVSRLLEAGILKEREVGRSRLIRANPDSPLTGPLREILLVSTGPVVLLAERLMSVDGIVAVFLYGSFAARMSGVTGPPPKDIDVMIIGNPDVEDVYAACEQVESKVGRPVNPTVLTAEEFESDTGFSAHVRNGPIVPVIGEVPWH